MGKSTLTLTEAQSEQSLTKILLDSSGISVQNAVVNSLTGAFRPFATRFRFLFGLKEVLLAARTDK